MTYKVGLVSTSSGQRIWPANEIDRAKKFLNEAALVIKELGFEVIPYPEIVCTPEDGVSAARKLRQSEIDLLVCYVGGWSYSVGILALAEESKMPLVLWTNTRPDTAGLVGAGIAKGALDEVGIGYQFVYGEFDEAETRKQLSLVIKGLGVKSRISSNLFGLFGHRTVGMATTAIDVNQWKRQFNIEVDCIDQLELVERAKLAGSTAVAEVKNWLKNRFGLVQGSDDVIDRSIRLYLAMLEIIKEKKLNFVAVRCLPELSQYYTTFCVANALLNDSIDHKGQKEPFVCACEADGNAALTMQMLKLLSGNPVNFGDVRYIDRKNDTLVICNCGSQAPGFANSPKEVHWLPQVDFQGEGGGLCSQYICKSGKVTIARASRVKGEYVMLIGTGECQEVPRERLRETTWEWPHAFVKLNSEYQQLLQYVRSNHMHMVYGDVAYELKLACEVMNIKPIFLDELGQ